MTPYQFYKANSIPLTFRGFYKRVLACGILEKPTFLRVEADYWAIITDSEHPKGMLKVKHLVPATQIYTSLGISRALFHKYAKDLPSQLINRKRYYTPKIAKRLKAKLSTIKTIDKV
jgi:hypothetical protein